MSLWADLQETFYITMGPFLGYLLLPAFVAAGMLLAILMSVSRFWRPMPKVQAVIKREE
jgi:hypothetical protein